MSIPAWVDRLDLTSVMMAEHLAADAAPKLLTTARVRALIAVARAAARYIAAVEAGTGLDPSPAAVAAGEQALDELEAAVLALDATP